MCPAWTHLFPASPDASCYHPVLYCPRPGPPLPSPLRGQGCCSPSTRQQTVRNSSKMTKNTRSEETRQVVLHRKVPQSSSGTETGTGISRGGYCRLVCGGGTAAERDSPEVIGIYALIPTLFVAPFVIRQEVETQAERRGPTLQRQRKRSSGIDAMEINLRGSRLTFGFSGGGAGGAGGDGSCRRICGAEIKRSLLHLSDGSLHPEDPGAVGAIKPGFPQKDPSPGSGTAPLTHTR